MEGFSEHSGAIRRSTAEPSARPTDPPSAIGTDERRMHVRAYNYWVSLLDGRDLSVDRGSRPANISDFGPNSVLLDFTAGRENPAMPYIGTAIRDECGLDEDIQHIDEVPSRSLLSRLTDHYLQIIANRAPIGFEAEFVNQRGAYHLLPRHPDALLVGRRHDRFHLWRHQLEGHRRARRPRSRRSRRRLAAAASWFPTSQTE